MNWKDLETAVDYLLCLIMPLFIITYPIMSMIRKRRNEKKSEDDQ